MSFLDKTHPYYCQYKRYLDSKYVQTMGLDSTIHELDKTITTLTSRIAYANVTHKARLSHRDTAYTGGVQKAKTRKKEEDAKELQAAKTVKAFLLEKAGKKEEDIGRITLPRQEEKLTIMRAPMNLWGETLRSVRDESKEAFREAEIAEIIKRGLTDVVARRAIDEVGNFFKGIR
jgi:hypothetical protein